ncbi:kinase-like domain-containing protein [Xylariaceae sp. FL0255]|nr:kinase-like domain-containing protein [Xylariaceae sp. FL0255]
MAEAFEKAQQDEKKEPEPEPVDYLIPESTLKENPFYGLAWIENGNLPRVELSINPTVPAVIATLKAALNPKVDYVVTFLHRGEYSKLYTVVFDNKEYVMRVSLPIWPRVKTESEVATLKWVNENSILPVPLVKAYDSSRLNPLGFEWILMSKVDGVPLSKIWHFVTQDAKERIVRQVARYVRDVFRHPFKGGIGSLFEAPPGSDGRHGPFSQLEWIASRLDVISWDLKQRINASFDVKFRSTANKTLVLVHRLKQLMPKFFPGIVESDKKPLRTHLWHDNLSAENIMVDINGVLRGVIDWQCMAALPAHDICQFPAFLQHGHDRFDDPMPSRFLVDDEGPLYNAYFAAAKRYEVTTMRVLFIEEMQGLCPDWVDIFRHNGNADLRDYETAIQNCDQECFYDLIEDWVTNVENGRDLTHLPRLHERFAEFSTA